MATKKRVFLFTDTFIQRSSYYVVAADEDLAEDAARQMDLPEYIGGGGVNDLEYSGCELEEEVKVITLLKISTGENKRPYKIRIIPTHKEDQTAFHGYRVMGEKVALKDRAYPKQEWQAPAK